MSLFSYISINPFELDYDPPVMIRESTNSFCLIDQFEGRIFSGSNMLGAHIHERLPKEAHKMLYNGEWLSELTSNTIKPLKPEALKEALFAFFEVFEELVYVHWEADSNEPVNERIRPLLSDEFRTREPIVDDLRKLLNRMFTNIAGGVFICEKAIRKGHTVCVTVG